MDWRGGVVIMGEPLGCTCVLPFKFVCGFILVFKGRYILLRKMRRVQSVGRAVQEGHNT